MILMAFYFALHKYIHIQTDLNVEINMWIGKEGRKKQDDNELLHHCFPLYLAQNMPEWYRVGT